MNVITSRPSQPGSGKPYVVKVPAPISTTKASANIILPLTPYLQAAVCVPKSVLCVVGSQYYVAWWWANIRGYAKHLPKKELLQ